jgi:1-acyl-sn-glycerol-3-phosphate acyltransferase
VCIVNNTQKVTTKVSTLDFGSPWIEWLNFAIVGLLLLLRKYTVAGAEYIPRRGGVVMVINHQANSDPFWIKYAIMRSMWWRKVYAMGKIELFRSSFMKLWMTGMRVFPVDRDKPSRDTLRISRSILESGHILGIFPQGGRNAQVIKPGAWNLAGDKQSPDKYPILIARLTYSKSWWILSHVILEFFPVECQSIYTGETEFHEHLAKLWNIKIN